MPKSPPLVDILGAESVAWHATLMMTTDQDFVVDEHYSAYDVFLQLIKGNGVKKRATRPAIPLGCRGSVLEVSEDMLQRTLATKHVRTALFALFPTLIEFQNEYSSAYVVKGEFKCGLSISFSLKHDVTRKTFNEIQNAVMSSYKPQYFLKLPSDPIQIDANRVRFSDIVPISINSHADEPSQSASSSGSQFAFAYDIPNEVEDM